MIRFLDLHKVNKRYEEEFKIAFQEIVNSGQYILGKQVLQFEKEFASYCGVKYCIGVNSGLDALRLIFEAYKLMGVLKEGDEVIVPANTFIATILAISHANLKPVLVEPDNESFNIDTSRIESLITKKTKAILGVHLYGQIYDAEKLETLANKYKLLLIEDAAQAHGARWQDGRRAGNLSHAAAFSFYPTKNLGALGDGGAITTNHEQLANMINKIRNYGQVAKYVNKYVGFNSRLDELQAIFLRIKLKHLDEDNTKRQTIAKNYITKIINAKIKLPEYNILSSHVFHLFVIRVKEREQFLKHLSNNGIETLLHYPIAPHKQEAFIKMGNLKLPITEEMQNSVVSLPISPVMSEVDVLKVIDVINTF